jgi:glycosyltransferase involved in cell wall biosynthesis
MKSESLPTQVRKILYVENGIGYGGAVICLRHLVRNLDRQRFTPIVVTGRTGVQYREIASEAEWHHIPDRRIDVVRMRRVLSQQHWIDQIPGLRFLTKQVIARLDDLGNFLPHLLQLLALALRARPALVHVNNEPLCNRAAILVGKLLRVPIVCHVRGTPNNSPLTHWVYRLPDRFISVSHWISDGLSHIGVPETKRSVVYDGIALEDLNVRASGVAFRQASGISRDAFVVGLVGLLIPWKGQHLFIDAAKELRSRIPKLKMLIIGGTPDECETYEDELRERIGKEGLAAIVGFTGHLHPMEPVYNGLDVVVSASTSPEPLGTMVIECMAMGRPLVAPDHGGAAEMTEHEKTALLFEPGDARALANAICRLHDVQGLSEQVGRAARLKALETFSVARHAEKIQNIYEAVLNKQEITHRASKRTDPD